jgi:SAM-dependent methyltransferase
MTQRSDRRIFLGMPGYGKASIHAARGFFRACADMSQVMKYHPSSSLLASNFNDIWCSALNVVHGGSRLDYFAMLHDDVAPEDGWLDKLIDELEENNLDLLGAVVPIKDSRGMTSMALHREGDNWLPFCRLSMRDVYCLPPTFTSDDLGGRKLLLNTGCWVIRWNQSICEQLHFEIRDRVVFNRTANRWQAQTEPEDWFFSRNAHALGLKIGATRKINLFHVGDAKFYNEFPWGQHPFDIEATKESPVPPVDRDGFRFPREIKGWLNYDEGKELWRLARGKRVLEIGCYCGASTTCLAQAAEHVTAVDYFDGRGTAVPQDTRAKFDASLKRHGVEHKVEACHPDAEFPLPEYDLAFIDGAHDYESVAADIRKALAVLAPGGLIAFHDYDSAKDPGVRKAVDELIATGGELLSITDTLAVVRPPAAILLEV